MDIPAPKENLKDTMATDTKLADPAAVAPVEKPANKPEAKPDDATKAPAPQDDQDKLKAAAEKDNEQRKKIVELVTSKQYNLGIKEKRSSPLLTVSLLPKKSKKSKHKAAPTAQSDTHKPSKKKESKNAKLIKLAVIIVLWVGFYLAIDSGAVDIGWEPPFSLFGNGDSPEALNFTGDTKTK